MGCSKEHARHLHQREGFYSSLRNKERGRDGNGRAAFIFRLPLKTVSFTRQEHVLDIIFSSEYKSSCVLRPSQRLVTLSWKPLGSKLMLHFTHVQKARHSHLNLATNSKYSSICLGQRQQWHLLEPLPISKTNIEIIPFTVFPADHEQYGNCN